MFRKIPLSIVLLLTLCCSGTAFGADKQGWPTLTLLTGGYSFGGSADIQSDLLYGIKLGYELNGRGVADRLGIEAVYQQLAGESETTRADVDASIARLDLLYLFDAPAFAKRLGPFLTLGAGGIFVEGDSVSESHPLLTYGLGARLMMTDYLGLRGELRQLLVFDSTQRSDYEYTVGLTYLFGVERKVKPIQDVTDSDRDGVVDSRDKCPETPAGLKIDKQGCPVDAPDADSDGVADYLDSCPDTPVGYRVDSKGCFYDDDGDGVPNERDRCPANPPGFQVDENGCTKLLRRSDG